MSTGSLNSVVAFLQAVLADADAAIVACDQAGQVCLVNRAAEDWHGPLGAPVPLADWASRYFVARDEGRPLAAADHPLARSLRGETVVDARVLVVDAAGRPHSLWASSRPVRDANGRLLGAVVVERVDPDAYKDEFLSVISHELRTPLNFITGFADILTDEIAGPLGPTQHEYVSKIQLGADRMLHLVENLLDASRVAAGAFPVHPVEAPYAPILDGVVAGLQPLAHAKQVALTAQVDVPRPFRLDGQRIVQVVTHLVQNAIKFTPAGGRVHLDARITNDRAITQVTDTGLGVAANEISRLFRAFGQLDMSSTRRNGGAGLGLVLSKAIVESHGGSIGVRSDGRDRGATFWFSLPV